MPASWKLNLHSELRVPTTSGSTHSQLIAATGSRNVHIAVIGRANEIHSIHIVAHALLFEPEQAQTGHWLNNVQQPVPKMSIVVPGRPA